MDFVQQYAWILWLALILIFVIVEVVTVDFTFLMLAIGSVGGLVASLIGAAWWVQVIIAAILALALIFTVRPPLLRALKRGGDHAKSNVEALLGMHGTVVIAFEGAAGTVKLDNGETWTATLGSTPPPPLNLGDRVTVTAIQGATAVVVPFERTTP
ncbi:NfeD family protein [Galbitalea soli]|uniref:NfeD family protein n=1 Tax=Galbitalea soli TaxID=1268042 RepID=A0A7C9PLB4_9MICO|nr:NfeD family protein [Galbitalea soli]NEM90046.1 NfeD family protein [Galbitalea soli]NYJ30753.1 membrane protein implicated in regulation of membrane protease activity [Galbitalea soli]